MNTAPRPREDHAALARVLFPDLATRLDAALARNEGSDRAGDDLDALLEDRANELRSGELAGAAFAEIADEKHRDAFATALSLARSVLARQHLRLPEPEEFEAAGTDFAALAEALATDDTLVPVPAPHGLGAEDWRQLFSAGTELLLASEIARDFPELDLVPDPGTPRVTEVDPRGRTLRWTLRLVPASEAPPVLGLAHASGPHPSLPEILLLQLMREAAGEPPLDPQSFTWLAGTLGGGALAARHVADVAQHAVRISSRGVSNQGPHLGARPPVG